MVKPQPTPAERARGALLAFAAGNALGLPAQDLGTAAAIAERYPDGLGDIDRRDTAASPWDDDVALALLLGDELLQPAVDLRRLARRWIEWARDDGRGIGPRTRQALDHIEHEGTPAGPDGTATNGAVSRCLPVALATLSSPRNLVSGTFHSAALTHPDPAAAWAAVAVNVAAARLLGGGRDFVPDVLEALRANDAPVELVEAVRRVPLERRDDLPVGARDRSLAVGTAEIALWCAYHEPNLERGLVWVVSMGGDADTNAAVAGGLMGARDGERAVPARWIAALPDPDRLRRLAERLTGTA